MTAAPFDTSLYDVKVGLSDAKASTNAKKIYQYLKDNYGKNIISGQYCDEGIFGHEMAVIWKATKKFPAMVGLDMIEYSPSRVANGSQGKSIDLAIQAWEEGSLVTMCWHWNAPKDYLTGQWYSGFYKEHTNINLDKIMNGQDQKGYDLLISDMDAIAKELTKLRDKDVPVLWRPLHEASGGWFWWGDCSAESYKKLYRLMYQKFTEEYELHNLIWVWNGQSADWFPGEDVVDILGIDIYPGEHVYTSQYPKYIETVECSAETRIVALSENGCLVDPDLALRDGAMWSYFGTWGGEFVTESKTLNAYSEKYTEEEMLIKVYNHEKVITRDELPDFTTYPVGE
jgi:mannan endo-1,4-beta-mannosidase